MNHALKLIRNNEERKFSTCPHLDLSNIFLFVLASFLLWDSIVWPSKHINAFWDFCGVLILLLQSYLIPYGRNRLVPGVKYDQTKRISLCFEKKKMLVNTFRYFLFYLCHRLEHLHTLLRSFSQKQHLTSPRVLNLFALCGLSLSITMVSRSKCTNLSLWSCHDRSALKSYCWAFLSMGESPDILESTFCGKIKMK